MLNTFTQILTELNFFLDNYVFIYIILCNFVILVYLLIRVVVFTKHLFPFYKSFNI